MSRWCSNYKNTVHIWVNWPDIREHLRSEYVYFAADGVDRLWIRPHGCAEATAKQHFTLDPFSLISEYDMEVRHYITATGVDRFQDWLDELQDVQTINVILRRIDRLKRGNLGDCRFCAEGVWELRIDFGPGYRIYYASQSTTLVLLLCAGTKRTQTTDIDKAIAYWRDFKRRQT